MKTTLKIEFDNEEAANHFMGWLCEQGEQDYWQWMECRESEEEGNITATFDYPYGKSNTDQFKIIAKCVRMDNDWKRLK